MSCELSLKGGGQRKWESFRAAWTSRFHVLDESSVYLKWENPLVVCGEGVGAVSVLGDTDSLEGSGGVLALLRDSLEPSAALAVFHFK